eukprot:SAG31_NODE_1093_length_9952_cov_16.099056_12_plen_196_part_00
MQPATFPSYDGVGGPPGAASHAPPATLSGPGPAFGGRAEQVASRGINAAGGPWAGPTAGPWVTDASAAYHLPQPQFAAQPATFPPSYDGVGGPYGAATMAAAGLAPPATLSGPGPAFGGDVEQAVPSSAQDGTSHIESILGGVSREQRETIEVSAMLMLQQADEWSGKIGLVRSAIPHSPGGFLVCRSYAGSLIL